MNSDDETDKTATTAPTEEWPDAAAFEQTATALRTTMDATQSAFTRLAAAIDMAAKAIRKAADAGQDDYALAPPPTDETRQVAVVALDEGGTWRCASESWLGEGRTARCVRHAGHPGRHESEAGTTW